MSLLSPLATFTKRFFRMCTYTWRDFWYIHRFLDPSHAGVVEQHPPVIRDELQGDLASAQRRPGSKAHSEPQLTPMDSDA